jgi:hypothetical protein
VLHALLLLLAAEAASGVGSATGIWLVLLLLLLLCSCHNYTCQQIKRLKSSSIASSSLRQTAPTRPTRVREP